jgi:hypothetical protein
MRVNASWMLVPEAATDFDNLAKAGKDEVGLPRKT